MARFRVFSLLSSLLLCFLACPSFSQDENVISYTLKWGDEVVSKITIDHQSRNSSGFFNPDSNAFKNMVQKSYHLFKDGVEINIDDISGSWFSLHKLDMGDPNSGKKDSELGFLPYQNMLRDESKQNILKSVMIGATMNIYIKTDRKLLQFLIKVSDPSNPWSEVSIDTTKWNTNYCYSMIKMDDKPYYIKYDPACEAVADMLKTLKNDKGYKFFSIKDYKSVYNYTKFEPSNLSSNSTALLKTIEAFNAGNAPELPLVSYNSFNVSWYGIKGQYRRDSMLLAMTNVYDLKKGVSVIFNGKKYHVAAYCVEVQDVVHPLRNNTSKWYETGSETEKKWIESISKKSMLKLTGFYLKDEKGNLSSFFYTHYVWIN